VSDGKVSSTLAPFTINVGSATKDGDVTLSWAPPAQYRWHDVTNLAGYRVYYSQTSGSTHERSLPSPSLTTVGIEGLATGTRISPSKRLRRMARRHVLAADLKVHPVSATPTLARNVRAWVTVHECPLADGARSHNRSSGNTVSANPVRRGRASGPRRQSAQDSGVASTGRCAAEARLSCFADCCDPLRPGPCW
jgi:hypothetical protein